MKYHRILSEMDKLIQSRSILNHPFYIAWNKGELTTDQLATYATMYYPHVSAFPDYLFEAYRNAENPLIRTELEQNYVEETSVPKHHADLWLDFAEGLGLNREDVVNAPTHRSCQILIDTLATLARGATAGALAAFYAYESQQPEVSRLKADGLRTLYGIGNPKTIAYFDVHAEADILHSEGERKAISLCMSDGSSETELIESTKEMLEGYWGLLDGVCDEAGIALN